MNDDQLVDTAAAPTCHTGRRSTGAGGGGVQNKIIHRQALASCAEENMKCKRRVSI